jgi:hypothetical protein
LNVLRPSGQPVRPPGGDQHLKLVPQEAARVTEQPILARPESGPASLFLAHAREASTG